MGDIKQEVKLPEEEEVLLVEAASEEGVVVNKEVDPAHAPINSISVTTVRKLFSSNQIEIFTYYYYKLQPLKFFFLVLLEHYTSIRYGHLSICFQSKKAKKKKNGHFCFSFV